MLMVGFAALYLTLSVVSALTSGLDSIQFWGSLIITNVFTGSAMNKYM